MIEGPYMSQTLSSKIWRIRAPTRVQIFACQYRTQVRNEVAQHYMPMMDLSHRIFNKDIFNRLHHM